MNSGLSMEQLDKALAVYQKVGKKVNISVNIATTNASLSRETSSYAAIEE
jgi:hypothetical protein